MLPRPLLRSTAATAAILMLAGTTACSTQAAESQSGKSTTITLWDQKGGDASAVLDDLIEEFNGSQKEYVVKRQFIAGTADQFASQIQNAIRTKDTPNIVFGDSNASRIGALLESEAVVDLTPYFGEGDHPVEKKDIFPGMLEPSTFDGSVYSLPTDGGAYALIYNTKAFSAAGIEPPRTWGEVAEASATLTSDGKYGIYLPIGPGEWTSFTWQSMLWSAGGEFLSEDNTSAEFASPAGVEALTTWTDLVKDGHAYPSSLDDDTQQTGIPGFIAGQVQMFIGRPADLAILDEALGEGVAEVVAFPELKQPAMNTGTNVSYILESSDEEKDAAWAFLSWALQPDQQAEWAIGTGYLPTSARTAESAAWQQHVDRDPRISAFSDQLDYARARPAIPEYAAVSSALARQIEKAMLQQVSPKAALDAAADEADAALSK
ncbi:ABC transporter substrate-binding protein [Microbacterium sp. 1.5R]|uniref:ABC transporter substrate-binding protein n=1 Tax=Microbacterium sp. 1.5R TaxID=1916917 RepID=UPI001642FC52|nr:ABC transporter substrate-binding protein [Microbacterium sp. 1.5R]